MPNLTAAELNHQNHYAMQVELDWLRETARDLPVEATIVMIGAGPGVMLLSMLECGRDDLWPTVIDLHSCQWVRRHLELATTEHPSVIPRLYNLRAHWIEGHDSYDVGKRWNAQKDGAIDLLVIDGDHLERGIKRDMEAWLDHVQTGGAVFFHDCTFEGTPWAGLRKYPPLTAEDYPEVGAFVAAEMKARRWPQIWHGGTAEAFRRPK